MPGLPRFLPFLRYAESIDAYLGESTGIQCWGEDPNRTGMLPKGAVTDAAP
jgi:hypothetical protein